VVVGAPKESSDSAGLAGDDLNAGAPQAGAVYQFVRDAPTEWSFDAYLKASNSEAQDHFGQAVAVDATWTLVGADDEDSTSTGIGGDEANNDDSGSGAAYLYHLPPVQTPDPPTAKPAAPSAAG